MLLCPPVSAAEVSLGLPVPGRGLVAGVEGRPTGAVCQLGRRVGSALRQQSTHSSAILPAVRPGMLAHPLGCQGPDWDQVEVANAYFMGSWRDSNTEG